MATTFARESNEILSTVQMNNAPNDSLLKQTLCRGIKRAISDDSPTNCCEPAIVKVKSDVQENKEVEDKKYRGSPWPADQPPVQAEIEITATPSVHFQFAPLDVTLRQTAQVKQQQAQLPKPLKDSLRRLKNLLKLPKARRWAYCEFFYSDIDRQLLLNENEFKDCLIQSIPNLKVSNLRRVEWRQVRRLIGKPRRCSQAFFNSERAVLEVRRSRIRGIQNGATLTYCNGDVDIPVKIPKQLFVGNRVFARVRIPKDGVYGGTIDAVMNGRYRIIFDKNLVMPLIVPDIEVMGNKPAELVAVSFFLEGKKPPAQNATSQGSLAKLPTNGSSAASKQDPLLSATSYSTTNATRTAGVSSVAAPSSTAAPSAPPTLVRDDRCGKFPLRFVVTLVKLAKLLRIKKIFLAQIQDMNSEAERMHLYADGYVQKFQQRYAKTIIDLERVNNQLETYLFGISEYSNSLLPQLSDVTIMSRPALLHKFCLSHAAEVVKVNSRALVVRSPQRCQLITSLTALLFQIRALGQQRCNAYELGSLRQAINEIKDSLDQHNRDVFEDYIEVHMKHVEFTMQSGKLATLSSNFTD